MKTAFGCKPKHTFYQISYFLSEIKSAYLVLEEFGCTDFHKSGILVNDNEHVAVWLAAFKLDQVDIIDDVSDGHFVAMIIINTHRQLGFNAVPCLNDEVSAQVD